MPGRSKLLISIFLLTLLVSLASLYQLFSLRFEAGDMFPAGSSLRSDPLGSMALYQALERTDGIKARRNYRPLKQQQVSASTILLLGSEPQLLFNQKNAQHLDQLAAAGNRVLIAFTPGTNSPATRSQSNSTADCTDEQRTTAWGIRMGQLPVTPQQPAGSMVKASLVEPDRTLPPEALFTSRLYLQPPASGWRTIYATEGKALVLERTIGSGSLVLVSDSSLFNNKAMKEARQSTLLAWLLGEQHTVIFDEAHLGVTEQGGIMALMRRFDLVPLLGALLALAALYIWQQSLPLVPPVVQISSDTALSVNHDSFNGLVNLLQRNLPANQLIKTCCSEWKKSFYQELQQDQTLRNELDDAMSASGNPVGIYQRIARLRAERKGR